MFFWKQLKEAILDEDFYATNEILEKNEAKDFFDYQKGVIDFNKGTIKIANDFIIYPNYTFKEFKESKFYKNQEAIQVIYLEGLHNLDNNNYMVSLFFRDEKIYMLSLICCDKQYCEENEKNRKELHDEILKQFDIVEKREFSWGVVASNYDARSNCSSIDFCYY